MCDCINQMDEALKEKNLEVDSTYPMRYVTLPDGNRTVDILPARPRVTTAYIEKPKRGSGPAPAIEIKFCPFCGAEYEPKQEGK